jgi:hypothetical protein
MKTDCTFTSADVGKNLYTKKTYYTVMIEQHVIAKDKDEADNLFLEHGGIDHSAVNSVAQDGMGVETTVCDANYTDSSATEYLGKVVYEDEPFAVEDGLVEIDTYAEEKPAEEKASDDFFPDARDQHLIRQDLTKATGGK